MEYQHQYQTHISMVEVDEREAEAESSFPRRSKRIKIKSEKARRSSKEFMSVAGDDLLVEIFLRLSHFRSLIRCTAVCKRWRSLITDPQFIRRRRRSSHPHKYEYEYELFLRYKRKFYEPTMRKSAELKFSLPDHDVEAWSEDLLVATRWPTHLSKEYCVCNPLTRELIVLPNPPTQPTLKYRSLSSIRCGLVCKRNVYKVVLIVACVPVFEAVIFSSATGKWTESTVSMSPQAFRFGLWGPRVVANDGILYAEFTATGAWAKGIFAIDAFNDDAEDPERCRFIRLPDCFSFQDEARLVFGAVRGKLRLSQLLVTGLKIWELNDDASSWDLVDEARVSFKKSTEFISVLAFDPNDSEFIFLLRDQIVCRHHIREDEYVKVGQFSFRRKEYPQLHCFLRAFTLVHPSWPTPLQYGLPSM